MTVPATTSAKPAVRPARPFFASGPCAKRPGWTAAPEEHVEAERKPFSSAEMRTLAVLAITSVLWLTDAPHHLSPAVPALIGAILLLAPRMGVMSWKTFEPRLSWGLILTVGTSLSLATMINKSGVAAWLGQGFLSALSGLSEPHVLIVATALIHLAITNLAACIALLLPITVTVAQTAGLDTIVASLAVVIVVDAVILYPVQTAANLLA